MKLFLLVCLVFAVSGINAYVTELSKLLKLTKQVNQYVSECVDETERDGELKTDPVTSMFSDEEDQVMERITYCFFHKAGILETDGQLNVDAALSMLYLIGVDKNDAEELLAKCTSITGYDATDTAFAVFKCFEDGFKG